MLNPSTTLENEYIRLTMLSLFLIRSIVSRYGGSMETDSETNSYIIHIPTGEATLCSQEIKEKVESLFNYIYDEVISIVSGNLLDANSVN